MFKINSYRQKNDEPNGRFHFVAAIETKMMFKR